MRPFSKEELKKMLGDANKVAIIGAGNVLRGDDAIGILVAYRLKRLSPNGAVVYVGELYPEGYLDIIARDKEITHVIYIDGIEAGEEPGTVVFVDVDELPQGLFETHKLPIRFFKRYLEQQGKKLIIIGVQVRNINIGSEISKDLFEKAMKLAEEIKEALEER